MKRILCLIDSLGAGGAQRQLVGLVVLLKESGYDVSVACYHNQPFFVDYLLANDVSYTLLLKAGNSYFRIWHISQYIRQQKPDVVIAYQEVPNICASVAHFFNRKFKLIVSERSTTQHTGRNERIRFNLFRNADFIVPNANSQAEYIKKTFPFLATKVVTIPNYVDLEYYTPSANRNKNKVPEIMIAASIWPLKNTLGFINAMSIVKEKGYIFHVSWYGKDTAHNDYFSKCQKRIEQMGLCEYIELKDKTKNILECYRHSDYFCLPSFFEGTPNVICEAMACGLPIACSNVCDNGRYVEGGINGVLFNPRNVNDMAESFERLINLSESEYDKYSQNSRERAENMLSKERFIQSYINVVES